MAIAALEVVQETYYAHVCAAACVAEVDLETNWYLSEAVAKLSANGTQKAFVTAAIYLV
jgi:hypothetical protein